MVNRIRMTYRTDNTIRRQLLFACMAAATWTAHAADSGQIQQGSEIALKGASGQPACVSCHGAKGEGLAAAGYPYLAGQPAQYLIEQLAHFADGSRKQPIMQPLAKALSEEQRAAVAAYYESLPPVFDRDKLANLVQTYPVADTGAWLAHRGSENPYIPACVQCHGPGGIGVEPVFPALAGQPEQYLKAQLTAMKSGDRGEDTHKLMTHLARNLSDEQIAQVSTYFAKGVLKPVVNVDVQQKGEVK
ncbi:c-type cytochrome [Advenella kashmirensis]|nr:c-type cytochrome [Advenella kashmirensis]